MLFLRQFYGWHPYICYQDSNFFSKIFSENTKQWSNNNQLFIATDPSDINVELLGFVLALTLNMTINFRSVCHSDNFWSNWSLKWRDLPFFLNPVRFFSQFSLLLKCYHVSRSLLPSQVLGLLCPWRYGREKNILLGGGWSNPSCSSRVHM